MTAVSSVLRLPIEHVSLSAGLKSFGDLTGLISEQWPTTATRAVDNPRFITRAAFGFVPWRKLPACESARNGKLEACPTGKFSSAACLKMERVMFSKLLKTARAMDRAHFVQANLACIECIYAQAGCRQVRAALSFSLTCEIATAPHWQDHASRTTRGSGISLMTVQERNWCPPQSRRFRMNAQKMRLHPDSRISGASSRKTLLPPVFTLQSLPSANRCTGRVSDPGRTPAIASSHNPRR